MVQHAGNVETPTTEEFQASSALPQSGHRGRAHLGPLPTLLLHVPNLPTMTFQSRPKATRHPSDVATDISPFEKQPGSCASCSLVSSCSAGHRKQATAGDSARFSTVRPWTGTTMTKRHHPDTSWPRKPAAQVFGANCRDTVRFGVHSGCSTECFGALRYSCSIAAEEIIEISECSLSGWRAPGLRARRCRRSPSCTFPGN